MIIYYDKLPPSFSGTSGYYYMAKAVDTTGKWEYSQFVVSQEAIPKFLQSAEQALKESCSKIVFHRDSGQPWTKTREEILNK